MVALGWRSTRNSDISTGARKAQIMPARRISRANVEIPAGQTAANRSDVEIFYTACRSRSIWRSTTRTEFSTGPTAAIHRAATR